MKAINRWIEQLRLSNRFLIDTVIPLNQIFSIFAAEYDMVTY